MGESLGMILFVKASDYASLSILIHLDTMEAGERVRMAIRFSLLFMRWFSNAIGGYLRDLSFTVPSCCLCNFHDPFSTKRPETWGDSVRPVHSTG